MRIAKLLVIFSLEDFVLFMTSLMLLICVVLQELWSEGGSSCRDVEIGI